MTREEALKSFEEENKDFEKTFERYGYQMSPEEVSAVKEAIERNKVAISALSTDGEYIKKEELINHLTELEWISDEPFNEVSIPKEVFDEVPTYSFPDSAENKGEWIHDNSHWKYRFNCSKCGYKLFEAKTNYCPNCGADMRGE